MSKKNKKISTITFVFVVDMNEKKLYSKHNFATYEEASAFAEGMKAAWKISHGYSNCWKPFVISDPVQELKDAEYGQELIVDDWEMTLEIQK